MPIFILLTSVIAVLLITIAPASAATSSTLNFQGRLQTNTGGLVPDGSYNIEFKIYDDPSAGTNWWTENRTGGSAVTVRNGYFSVYLGEVTPFSTSIPWDQDLWMTMNVNADGEMSPRFKLTAVPYAFRAGAVTDSAGNAFTGDDLIQKSPATIQAVNSALAAIRLNQAGAGGLLQLQSGGTDVFTVDNSGNATVTGAVTSGTATQSGLLSLQDGSGNSLNIQSGTQAGDLTFTFPVTYGTSGQCLKTNGSGTLSFGDCAAGGGGAPVGTTVVKTSNTVITNDNTLNNDVELLFPVGANETWAFRFVVQANSATQPDLQFAVTAPSGATCTVGIIDPETAVSVGNLGCGVASGLITGNGTNDVYEITGTVVNGANAGDVTLQWAQNTANANATTVYAGSYLFATSEGAAAGGGTAFEQGGNAFSGTAILGTTDANGLDIITNGGTRLGFTSAGDATFSSSLTISSGGLTVSGGIDNNNSGLTEAGSISGLTSLAGTGSLTLSSGGAGNLILDSASDVLVLSDSTLRRTAVGTTVIDLLDAGAGTTLSLLNSSGSQVAGLLVEGDINALAFTGSGAGLTGLDAGNISTGIINDLRLSSNVVLLDQSQTFSGTPTFGSGLILGNSTSTTSGAIRWSGTDFEGYDGIQWVSLTSGGSGGGGGAPVAATFYDAAGGDTIASGVFSTINFDSTLNNSDATIVDVVSDVVTVTEAGFYEVSYQVTTRLSSGTRSGFNAKLQLDSGGGFTDVAGSQAYHYGRITSETQGTSSATVILDLAVGDSIRLQGRGTTQSFTTIADATSLSIAKITEAAAGGGGGGLSFEQGGNDFGGTAILGTTVSNDLNFITNNSTALSLTTTNQAIFTGDILANGGITIGNDATDGLTIVSDSVVVSNGLNFDSNTFVIDSANNRVGIGTATTNNLLTINDASTADAAAQVLLSSGVNTNKGLVIQGVASQSANLFEIQNNSGVVLGGFNSNGGLVLGLSTVTSSATGSQSINFADESGTVCLSGSSSCGFLSLATGSFVTDATTNNTIAINKTGASGNLLALQKNGGAVFTVANTGALQIQSTDSAALDIRNVAGTSFFSVDTSTGIVRVGPSAADANGVLFVLDTKNTLGDPVGTDGGIYYNSSVGKFRCYEDSTWKDCIGARQVRSFIDTTVDPVADNNTTDYWDIAVENNNSVPNLTPSSINKSITGSVSFETQSTTTADRSVVARVERSIGVPAACNSGTPVGTILSTFTTNNGEQASNTMIFLDNPNTTSVVYYTLCADAATNNAGGMSVNRIRVTLEEANNSN